MILVVCLNLAVDETIQVDHLEIGHVHRSKSTLREAGGKGANVARVLRTLGAPCVVTGFLGGAAGKLIADSFSRDGISCVPCPIQNENRSCFIFAETQEFRQTVINEPGPAVTREEVNRFVEQFDRLLGEADLVMMSGSLPPGAPEDTYAQLISLTQTAGKRALLDSSGPALGAALKTKPFLLKINQGEAADLLGRTIHSPAEAAEAARRLREESASLVMITLGAEGALLASMAESCHFLPPTISAKNSVGSGDASFAGLAVGLLQGLPIDQMASLAVAAGAANALHGGGHCTREEIQLLLSQVRRQSLN